MYVSTFLATNHGEKTPALTADATRHQVDLMLSIAQELGHKFSGRNCVLDFGCGIGDGVRVLLEHGYDAYGVDVGEWWGRDYGAYWHDSPIPEDGVASRLSATSEGDYRLPYADGFFDLVLSSQVFEHVFNYVDVFKELKRVTKPGGVSVHLFPGPSMLTEPHLGIPVNALTKYDWWLLVWAPIFRDTRQKMKANNYPTRRELEAFAKSAGVTLSFHEQLYIDAAKGRPWILQRRLPFLAPLFRLICQRCMSIKASP
jgi:SAM-dependent methyltransferase